MLRRCLVGVDQYMLSIRRGVPCLFQQLCVSALTTTRTIQNESKTSAPVIATTLPLRSVGSEEKDTRGMSSKSNRPVHFGRMLLRNCLIALSVVLWFVVSPTQADDGIPGRINGGTDAVPGRYAYTVALSLEFVGFLCGGSLIAPDIVLTAAHCVDDFDSVSRTSIRTRPYNLNNPVAESEEFDLDQIVIHPEYDRFFLRNDVALLKLSGVSNNQVLSVLNEDASVPVAGQSMTVVGWGDTTNGFGIISDVLQELGAVTYIENDTCQKLDQEAPGFLSLNFDIEDDVLCTFDPPGQGACNGDSGELHRKGSKCGISVRRIVHMPMRMDLYGSNSLED